MKKSGETTFFILISTIHIYADSNVEYYFIITGPLR